MSELKNTAQLSSGGAISLPYLISTLVDHGCPDITLKLKPRSISKYPVHGGGFGDVYSGRMTDGTDVAIKCARYRIPDAQHSQNLKLMAREVHAWSKCKHENVLELLGLAQHRDQLAIISPWMDNGMLPEYITKHPEVDRLDLCLQITRGLAYLHQKDMIHGDLKGANVLVSSAGVLKLADFGNSKLKEQTLYFSTRTSPVYSLRWAAPEILNGSRCSSQGDIYALGMTIYETVTGSVPYKDKPDMAVVTEVLVHRRFPPRGDGSILIDGNKDRLWDIMESCWNRAKELRPKADEVEDQLSSIPTNRHDSQISLANQSEWSRVANRPFGSSRVPQPQDSVEILPALVAPPIKQRPTRKPDAKRKLVIVGDGACGKTSLFYFHLHGTPYPFYVGTVFDNHVTNIEVGDKVVELGLWDTAGDESYDRLRPLSYPNSDVVLICFAIDSPVSLSNIEAKWIEEVRHFCPNIEYILVGCKNDLRYDPRRFEELKKTNERPVSFEEGVAFAQKIGAHQYLECSGTTGEGIDDVLQRAATLAVSRDRPKSSRRKRLSECIVS